MEVPEKYTVGVVGLGYVGLPLIMAVSKKYKAIGYDINSKRILDLNAKVDSTGEVNFSSYSEDSLPVFTSVIDDLIPCNFYVITVPTPVDDHNVPDLSALRDSCRLVGNILAPGDFVVFESTVFPGATEEVCIPELENSSKLICNEEFFVGYSPERVNPGDKARQISDIIKITSGSNAYAAEVIDQFYKSIITAGTYPVDSLKIAEAAKIIENIQRDVNIALINELAMLFKKLDIDTNTVLDAACTKWNFLNFRPGLVGGHCIGVDPYYLTYKALAINHNPQLILAGRKINDEMASNCVSLFVKKLIKNNLLNFSKRILVAGYTFKENCPDIRNTKVAWIVKELIDLNFEVEIYDPHVLSSDRSQSQLKFVCDPLDQQYIGCLIAVGHDDFICKGSGFFRDRLLPNGVLFDVKGCFDILETDLRL